MQQGLLTLPANRPRYLTFQVRVQVGDGPYVGPALALGVATMLIVTTTFLNPLVRILTFPDLYTVNLHSFEELNRSRSCTTGSPSDWPWPTSSPSSPGSSYPGGWVGTTPSWPSQ